MYNLLPLCDNIGGEFGDILVGIGLLLGDDNAGSGGLERIQSLLQVFLCAAIGRTDGRMQSRGMRSTRNKEPTLNSSSVGTTSFFNVSRIETTFAPGSFSFIAFCSACRR